MKNINIVICCIVIQFIMAVNGSAQIIELKPAISIIAIDGDLSEWGDQVSLKDKKGKISYLISNDRNNLYLVLKTKDSLCQANILGSGITFTVSTNNPNVNQKVTFPLKGKEDPSEYMNMDKEQVAMKTILARYKRIGVQNFKNIKAEELSTTNPYGIKVALGYTEDGDMVYEEAIPLTLLFPDGINEKCSYSIKVNGLARKIFYQGHSEMVPVGNRSSKNKEERIKEFVVTNFRGNFQIGGPMPQSDYEDKLTADIQINGEFIFAK